MLTHFWTILLALVLGLYQSSCTTLPGEKQAAKVLLWQLEHPSHPTSYVFGTIHVGVGIDELPAVVSEKFAASQQFVSELHLDELTPEKSMALLIARPGQSVTELLTSAQFNNLANQLASVAPKPFLAKMTVGGAQSLLILKHFPSGESLDRTLMQQAAAQGKTSVGLETIAEQMKTLELLLTKEALVYLINNPGELRESLAELVTIYLTGDEEELAEAILTPDIEAMAMSKEALEAVIYARNRSWAAALPQVIGNKSTFIAVGAGHLPGPEGLLNLLRARGFRVARVSP